MKRRPETRARRRQQVRSKAQRTIEPRSAKEMRQLNRYFTRPS